MSETRVEAALRMLRNRIWLGKTLESLSATLLVSSVLALLLAAARHALVIPHLPGRAGLLLAALWTAGFLRALAGRPGIKQAAATGDRGGLQDRLSTYLEYRQQSGAVMEMFREEMDYVLAGFSPARVYPLNVRWKRVLAAVVLFTAAGCLYWLPSSRAEKAALLEEVNMELRQEAKNVALVKEAMEEAGKGEAAGELSGEKASSLLDTLERKLERGYDYREAARQVEDTLIEMQSRGLTASELKGLAGIFAGAGETGAGATALMRSGEAPEALKKLNFGENERVAVLDNTLKMLKSDSLTPGQRQALRKVQSALEKEGPAGKELAEAMAPVLSDEKAAALEETAGKLRSMKERLLARAGEGTENTGSVQLAQDEQAEWGTGEITRGAATLTAQGDNGQQYRPGAGALGGGVPGGGGTEAAREGMVEKSDEPVLSSGDSSGTLEVKGEWHEDSGRINEIFSGRVEALSGEDGGYQAFCRQFQKEGASYLERFDIPPDKRRLVLEYFRELRGDRPNGYTD